MISAMNTPASSRSRSSPATTTDSTPDAWKCSAGANAMNGSRKDRAVVATGSLVRLSTYDAALATTTPTTMAMTTALVAGGLVLYLPANLLPMALTIQFTSASSYTVFGGIVDLGRAGLWPLAALVFVASFAIPLLKLTGMVWLLWSVHTGSTRASVQRSAI